MVTAGYDYHLLRAALGRFGKPPAELQPAEMSLAESQARRQYELECRILQSDEARDVMVPEAVLESSVSTVAARYADQAAFLADVRRNNMDEASFRDAVRRELTVEAVLERVGSRAASISDLDVMIYYYVHPEKFERPETRTVRHILITVNPQFPENTLEVARQRIGEIARRVQQKPHRFAEQAKKHSECPTAMQGGMLGTVDRGRLYEQLDPVLFGLKEGQVSDPVQSELGFHLLYCETVHAAGTMPLAEARSKIREVLLKRRRRMCQRGWLAALQVNESVHEGEAT